MSAEGKRDCVIGAGFGGLALAIRRQADGSKTTRVEARGNVPDEVARLILHFVSEREVNGAPSAPA